MAGNEKIIDAGGVVGIEVNGKLIRVASVDGTRTADLVQVLKAMLDAAREEGRKESALQPQAA